MQKPKVNKKLLSDLDDDLSESLAIVKTDNVAEAPHTKNKLTPDQVTEIRQKLADGVPQVEIALEYNVDKSTISSIKIGKTWRTDPDNPLDAQIMIPSGKFDGSNFSKDYIDEAGLVFKPNGSFTMRRSEDFEQGMEIPELPAAIKEANKNYASGPVDRAGFFQSLKDEPLILNITLDGKHPEEQWVDHFENFINSNEAMIRGFTDGNKMFEDAKKSISARRGALQNKDLFGDPLPEIRKNPMTPAECFGANIMGEDIIKIRALTGKAQDRAKDALKAAAVEFMAAASPDCFWVPYNVPSSKNSKDIGFYLKKNPKTGNMERVHVLVDSARTKKYKRDTKGYWLQNKIEFLNQTRHLPLPLHIEFTFIRDSLRAFDFINACQVLADLMGPKENSYFADDDTVHFLPVFNPVVYYHPETPGVLFRVIK